ncbi:MAG: 3-isopropylmalate dehydratase small subunit [Candidatus Marinimicrobia bacterium]|nr:3-isopropylmalate dehydratase small subunit [Candidatus Neomarinimicrobiota bacterium]
MKGRAIVYKKDHINTDEIIPARYLNTDRQEELALHAMEDLDLNFKEKTKWGSILVAGENFGCGSSREHAVWALRGAGIKAIVCESFARIFYRNCINNGFLAIECKNASKYINDGDIIELNLKEGELKIKTTEQVLRFQPLPKFALEIIESGGLMSYISKGGKF